MSPELQSLSLLYKFERNMLLLFIIVIVLHALLIAFQYEKINYALVMHDTLSSL